MKVNQISSMLNDIYGEVLGQDNLFEENLGNIVSCGQIITSSTFGDNFDNYAGKIIDKVGRSIFVDRVYRAKDLGIWRDSWEYASMLEKVRCEVKEYTDNDEWKLLDGSDAGADPDYNSTSIVDKLFGFVGPEVQAKYFNLKTTFRNKISITRKQLKSAFNSASDMGRFIAMIENRIRTKLEIGKNELERRVITNLACAAYDAGNYVDLYSAYVAEVKGNNSSGVPEDIANALKDPDILRFIAEKITMTRNLMSEPSKNYSITGNFMNFTPEELARLIVIDDLDVGLKFHLYGDTYNEEFVKLQGYKTIPFWQGRKDGSYTDKLDTRSLVLAQAKVKDSSDSTGLSVVDKSVGIANLVGILFDRDAAMICNEDPEVRSQYNPDGNFTNFFYNYDCSYYNDFDENAVIFTWNPGALLTLVAGSSTTTTRVGSTLLKGDLYAKSGDTAQTVTLGSEFDTTGWTAVSTTGDSGTTITTAATKIVTVVATKTVGNTKIVVGVSSAEAVVGSGT